MASITSLMNNSYNTSSIYGTRNVLSGLASGMDTETMIENAVSGIKRRIQGLYQKRTKVEWQQEAYRSIIDRAVNLSNKYTSYSSKTNLLSSSFFSNAVINSVNGTYANKITATGKTNSDIKINAVKQLATAATYSVSGSPVFGGNISTITGGKEFDLYESMDVSNIAGGLTLQYGGSNGTSFSLDFDELEVYDSVEDLADAIREKLGEQTYTYTKNGVRETVKGSDVIDVRVNSDGAIRFSDKTNEGNSVYISSVSGGFKSALGVSTGEGKNTIEVGKAALSRTTSTLSYLSGKTLTLNLNGTSKSISMNRVLSKAGGNGGSQFVSALQDEINNAFGKDKVNVGQDENGALTFEAAGDGSTLTLGGSALKALGFENGDSNFINTSKKLGDLLGKDVFNNDCRLMAVGAVTEKSNASGVYLVDSKGNKVEKLGDGKYYQIDDTGKALYDFKINGNSIKVTEDTTLESLMNSINANADMGMKVSYSRLTNEFKFTATETGANGKIEFGGLAKEIFGTSGSSSDNFMNAYGVKMKEEGQTWLQFEVDGKNIAGFLVDDEAEGALRSDATMEDIVEKLNGNAYGYAVSYDEVSGQIVVTDENGKAMELKVTTSSDIDGKEGVEQVGYQPRSRYTAGQDAVMDVEINGVRFENLTRSSNSFDVDGLNITVKGTFSEGDEDYEPVTFETTTDADKIIDAIRDFVNDYNEMVTELKGAYSTQPAYNSSGDRYEPLTADEEEGYSESELASYNEKAKQGILFGDTTLSSFYSKLLNAIAPGGADGQTLRAIGIGTSYENGLTTISLDEDKLRSVLESDPDKVRDAFTKTTESGSSSNGLMQTLQNTLNTYAGTTGEPKGVLIMRAGSIKAPTSLNNNSLNTQINSIDKQIQRWQNKMSNQIDRYTKQFSKLEQLVAAMNSQASALAGLMGGAEGYY